MKKRVLSLGILLLIVSQSSIYAQNYMDALRYSQYFYEGTARTSAMGNAFTALGGDLGAISINPASSGIYRHSEFSVTPSFTTVTDWSTYSSQSSEERRTKFGVSSFGFVGSMINNSNRKDGLIRLNYSIGANKVNNFTSRSTIKGGGIYSSWLASLAVKTGGIDAREMDMLTSDDNYPFTNSGAPWESVLAWNSLLLDTLDGPGYYIAATENIDGTDIYQPASLNQHLYTESTGNTTEYYFNIGGNISDKFFFGATLTYQSIWYDYYERYYEESNDPYQFQTGFKSLTHVYNQTASGYGVNFKVGVIYLPISFLRLGASISTPTLTVIDEEWSNSMTGEFLEENYSTYSPIGTYSYRVKSPTRINLGAAIAFPSIGLISVDYENVNYSNTKMIDIDRGGEFDSDNSSINRGLKSVNNLRIGAEIKAGPWISIRGGYSYYDSPYKYTKEEKHILSGGVGFSSGNGFFMDASIQIQLKKNEYEFSLYDKYTERNPPLAFSEVSFWRALITMGLKF